MKKWECTVCGYVHEGDEPPEKCPICSAPKEKFIELKAEDETGEQAKLDKTNTSAQTDGGGLVDKISGLIVKNHLHPISVHTPNGIVPIAVVFLILAMLVQYPLLDHAAYFNMIAAMLAMPVVLLSGVVAWQKKYNGVKTTVFQTKIAAGFIATSTLFLLVIWRTVQPDILSTASAGRWFFLLLSLILLGAVGLAGHLGGQLVFAAKK